LTTASEIVPDPFIFPLAGGEDYELLFTAPRSRETSVREAFRGMGAQVTPIGEITSGPRLIVRNRDGSEYPVTARGYNHFGAA
jgi:thiamine-monophosphate kinase